MIQSIMHNLSFVTDILNACPKEPNLALPLLQEEQSEISKCVQNDERILNLNASIKVSKNVL